MNDKQYDVVNCPSHYVTANFECIDVMLETQGTEAVRNFCICNAFKYIYRHNGKNGDEDIKKAKWYIDKYLSIPNVSSKISKRDAEKYIEMIDDYTEEPNSINKDWLKLLRDVREVLKVVCGKYE